LHLNELKTVCLSPSIKQNALAKAFCVLIDKLRNILENLYILQQQIAIHHGKCKFICLGHWVRLHFRSSFRGVLWMLDLRFSGRQTILILMGD